MGLRSLRIGEPQAKDRLAQAPEEVLLSAVWTAKANVDIGSGNPERVPC